MRLHVIDRLKAHDTYIRDAKYSHSGDWLLSADQDGQIKYWQPNFNNVKTIRAHDDAVHEISYSPTDSKYVTASHDTTLKIWDFSEAAEESVLRGHGWEAKCVDWHPTKGLIVSGSKDHQIKLWDPRTGRCLTTLHGHKNTIQKTKFEPTQGDMLATCARDHIARIFDIRMMRDVLLLRGHEKDITTLAWHPFHKNLLTTGGIDGSIFHYLLDEQHAPVETGPTLSPYESSDPQNAPAQTIYPAHKIQNAHEYTVWTLDWHPLGHIMASGSQDKATRFWTRPRPGDSTYRNDRFHIGQSAAEALGTWNRRDAQRQEHEEQQEAEDEAEGLVDQKMPSQQTSISALPGLPGLAGIPGLPGLSGSHDGTSVGGGQLPGINHAPLSFAAPADGSIPLPPPPLPPNFDPAALAQMGIPPPFLPPPNGAGSFPPPLPSMLPPGFQFPPGFPPPPPATVPVIPPTTDSNAGLDASGVRRRGPLPSQKDSLQAEMRRGNYLKPR